MIRLVGRLAIVTLFALSTVAVVSAHLEVTKTSPAADVVVNSTPERLKVWFSQTPTLAVSSLVLESASGRISLGKVTAGQTDGKPDNSLVANITGSMTPGAYTVRWKTSGKDGHILTGTFEFSYTPSQ